MMAMLNFYVSCSNMRSWKWPPSPYKGKWQQTFTEVQAMETFKKKVSEEQNPTTNFHDTLIDCFRSYGSSPSPSAYSFLIKYLLQRRLLSHLHLILNHLEKAEKFEIPERMFVYLIKKFGKADMLQDAINIFFRIPKFRCTPSAVSLNSLLYVLCKKKEGLVLVGDVLLKTPEMNIRLDDSTFRILIGALCRNGNVASAIELLNMMPLHECSPDARMYSTVLRALWKQASSTEVMHFLKGMRDAGFLPNVFEYNFVINLLVKEGKTNDAYSVLTQMKLEGRRPDIVIYNSILDGFNLADDFHMVDYIFDEILLMGLIPDAFTYKTYINSLCKQGDFERAGRLVVCMERAGCKPDIETCNMLMTGYTKSGEQEEARKVTTEILEKDLHWNT